MIESRQVKLRVPNDRKNLVIVIGAPSKTLRDLAFRAVEYAYHDNGFVEPSRSCDVWLSDSIVEISQAIATYSPELVVVDTNFKKTSPADIDGLREIVVPARKAGYKGRILCMGFPDERIKARKAGADELVDENDIPSSLIGNHTGVYGLLDMMSFLLTKCPFTYTPLPADKV